jgi:hypothetical protein
MTRANELHKKLAAAERQSARPKIEIMMASIVSVFVCCRNPSRPPSKRNSNVLVANYATFKRTI